MKRFLLNITAFTVLIYIILWIPQYLFDHRACNNHTVWPFKEFNRMDEWYPDSVADELLVMGNSRGYHYVPEVMKEFYSGCVENLSMRGYSFDFQYHMMLKKYLQKDYHPKYILQEVGPFSFFGYVNPKLNIAFFPYIQRSELAFMYDFRPGLTVFDKYLPIKYRGNLDKMYDYWKEMDWYDTLQESDDMPKSYCIDNIPFHVEYFEPSIIHLFHSYIQECDSLGIKLILIVSPMHTEDGIPKYDWDSFNHIMDSVTAGYDLPLLDYTRYFGNDTTYFNDPIHLTQDASRIYSRIVMHDLDSLGLIRN